MSGLAATLPNASFDVDYFARGIPMQDRLAFWYEAGQSTEETIEDLKGGDDLAITGTPAMRRAGMVVDINNYATVPWSATASCLMLVIARRPAAGQMMLMSNFLGTDPGGYSSYNLALVNGSASTFLSGTQRTIAPPSEAVDSEWCALLARLSVTDTTHYARSLFMVRQGVTTNDNVDVTGTLNMAPRQMRIGRGYDAYSNISNEVSLMAAWSGLVDDPEVAALIAYLREDWRIRKSIVI